MAGIDKLKKNRSILRSSVTKLVNNIDTILKNDKENFDSLKETLNELKIKASNLAEVNNKIEILISADEYEVEMISTYEYAYNIYLTNFCAKKIKEILFL